MWYCVTIVAAEMDDSEVSSVHTSDLTEDEEEA